MADDTVQRFACRACGQEFTRKPVRGQRPKWCPACRNGYPDATRLCPHCGRAMRKDSTLYCSRECRRARRPLRYPPLIDVPRCVLPRSHPARRAPLDSGRVWVGGNCPRCGASFIIIDQLRNRYCSLRCARGDAKDRYRARTHDAFVEPVYRSQVFERDGWICQLCMEPVDRTAHVPEWLAPTIDHVVPLNAGVAAGAEHSMRGVQCAHFICNARKSDRVDAA